MFFPVTFRAIPESLVWLIAKGRTDEAERILERAAAVNGRHLPEKCLHDDVTAADKPEVNENNGNVEGVTSLPVEKTYTVIDLVRTPALRKITFCISGLW